MMNTTILITLIVCSTAIALAAIIFEYCTVSKFENYDANCFLSKKIIKLHRNYIAGILGFALMMLLTAKLGGVGNGIFEYLSFGSTITSLVLSILAIFVTVQSTSDLYKQFTKIDHATDVISNVSQQIEGTLKKIKEVDTKLTSASESISNSVNSIVDQVDGKFRKRMEQTEEMLSKYISQNSSALPTDTNSTAEYDSIGYFIEVSSFSGLLVLYACALSKKNGKPFELSKLFEKNEEYSYGFLIASNAADFINFTNDQEDRLITCTKIKSSLDDIYDKIKYRINNLDKGKEFCIELVNRVNNYFDEPLLNLSV